MTIERSAKNRKFCTALDSPTFTSSLLDLPSPHCTVTGPQVTKRTVIIAGITRKRSKSTDLRVRQRWTCI